MHTRVFLIIVMILSIGRATVAFGQFEELEKQVLQGANVVVAMDVAAINHSHFAQKHGWSKTLEAKFIDRTIFLPPQAEKLLIASHVQPERNFSQDWEVAILQMAKPLSMSSIARAEGGSLDEIRGKQTVLSQNDAILVPLDQSVLGILTPANRQMAAGWIRNAGSANSLSSYLGAAISRVNSDTQIVLAIDLQDIASAQGIENRLKASPVFEESKMKLEDVVSLLQSIQGVAIDVSIGEEARAKSRIEFGKPVTLTDSIAKKLVLEMLGDLGLEVPDLKKHQFGVAGRSIFAEGHVSVNGLRRLFSLLEVPASGLNKSNANASAETPQSSQSQMASSSQAYFSSVVVLLDDLRGDRSKQDTRGGMDAVWMERYARKIDRLPILNVDEALLEWGSKTAETLRIMSQARRGAGLAAGAQKSGLRTGMSYGSYYDNGGYGVGGSTAQDTELDAAQIDRQLQNRATGKRVEGWRLIDDATAAVRQEMTQKYQVEFEVTRRRR